MRRAALFATRRKIFRFLHAQASQKNLNSDDHFDRLFSFSRDGTQNPKSERNEQTMNPLTKFKTIRILPLLIAPTLAALVALTAMPARATPPCGVVTTTNLLYPGQPVDAAHAAFFPSGSLDLLCTANLPAWLLKTIVQGDSDVYIVQSAFDAGSNTGWHSHPGPSLITVTSGTLKVYEASDPTCTPKIYTAGQSFTDLGCGDVHLVANASNTEPAVDIAVQIVPHNALRRIDVPVAPSNCPLISCP
jgi:quercetin dioxygenase-like cupin family protein